MEKLNKLVELAKELGGESWGYRRTTPYSRGYITGHDGRTIVQATSGEVPANVCNFIEMADPETILAIAEEFRALAAENAMLKSGLGFFSYGSDSGFEEHDSAEKAIAAADSDIDYYRGDACDGWSEETDQTVWGVILQRATMIDERPCSEELPHGSCDFALLPNLATPATDAYLNSVRAEGVDMFGKYIALYHSDSKLHAVDFAAQLRAGKDGE